jgi:hypothetical protein
MKTKAALFGLVVVLSLCFILPDAVAQGKKNGPPPWAPAHGYRAKTRQIYFPEQNFYYDTQRGVYIYLNGPNWEVNVKLPSIFAAIDLGRAAKVELKLNTDFPQQYNAEHQLKYKAKDGKGYDKAVRKEKKRNRKY